MAEITREEVEELLRKAERLSLCRMLSLFFLAGGRKFKRYRASCQKEEPNLVSIFYERFWQVRQFSDDLPVATINLSEKTFKMAFPTNMKVNMPIYHILPLLGFSAK